MSLPLPSGTRCLVTGASDPDSVGYACAESLLKAGAAFVTVMGRDEDSTAEAAEDLANKHGKGGSRVGFAVGDLREPDKMGVVVQDAVDVMGGLDILIVSGGNGGSEYLGLDASSLESYRLMQDVGVLSPIMLTEAAVPHLSKSEMKGGGTVVMISSSATETPWPDTAPFNYAKAAQNCAIETLAFKNRRNNVRVNGVLAACIHTGALDRMAEKKGVPIEEYAALRAESHPVGRNGTPEDVANAALFLASPASSFTTGELLRADGGLHLSNWFNKPRMLAEFKGGTD